MTTNHNHNPAPIRTASDKPRQVFGPVRPAPEPEGTFVTISIGRNVHSDAGNVLSAARWSEFKGNVTLLFAQVEFIVHGHSQSVEHDAEETFIIGGTIRDTDQAKRHLSGIVRDYDQDAAAWVEGGERIVPPDPTRCTCSGIVDGSHAPWCAR